MTAPHGYRDSNPKIYTWTKANPDALATNWSRTVFEARQARAEALGVPVHEVMGRKA